MSGAAAGPPPHSHSHTLTHTHAHTAADAAGAQGPHGGGGGVNGSVAAVALGLRGLSARDADWESGGPYSRSRGPSMGAETDDTTDGVRTRAAWDCLPLPLL